MESITNWLLWAILKPVLLVDLSPLPGKPRGKLRLTPEQLLAAFHTQAFVAWSLQAAAHFQLPRLKRGLGDDRPSIQTAAPC